jgi:hypothetical protein
MSRRATWALAAVACLALVAMFRPVWGVNQAPAAGAVGAKYTIVDTEGTNLLVVDNSTNTLYYYTVDPGKEVGDDLKLRGTVDLNEVGKDVIKPKAAAKQPGGGAP